MLYLTASTGLFAIFALDQNNNGTMSYVIKDHQGSMRNPQTLSYDNVTASFDRGYTLHEHYDDFGLINMNGRLYDPLVGRMLSPDIVIQDEQNSQAYNRYSYCFNNPLRFTDPSGYISVGGFRNNWRQLLYLDSWNTHSSTHSSFSTDESLGNQIPIDDWYEDSDGNINWTDYKSQAEMDKAGLDGKYLGEAVVIVKGSYDEKLGENGTLTGEGANPAKITIYGINGENDIKTYNGLSVSSDPSKYSMVANGDYKAFYQDMATSPYGSKGGSLSYLITNLDGSLKLPTEGGEINKNHPEHGAFMKEIFFHRTNNNGKATHSSQGCIIIDASPKGSNWEKVENQLKKSSNIFFRINR